MSTAQARAMSITVSRNQRKEQTMPTRLTRLIRVTDDQGALVLDEQTSYEPLPGSIIMTEGVHGTAWQRWHCDGLWHRCGSSQKKDWDYLLTKRNVVLVYDADQRQAS
jgi:hypothetical protein